MSNATEILDAYQNLEYARFQALEHQKFAEFNRWLAEHSDNDAIYDALVMIADIQALDELRLEAAGYSPQPLQEVLWLAGIMNQDAVQAFKRSYVEARN